MGRDAVTAKRNPNPTPPPCTSGRPRSQVEDERYRARMALHVTLSSLEATPAAEDARETLRALEAALDAELEAT